MLAQMIWPPPARDSYFTRGQPGRDLEDQYLATCDALDDDVDGTKELDRLLNPDNPSTTLQTLVKAAGAVGKRVKISLVKA